MAATKISALGTLAQDSIAPANDLLNLVDVSDTTMGAGGTNKKATIKSTISKSLDDLAATWNNGAVDFTAIKMNVTDTASGASSLLMDLQVGGASRFNVAKDGYFTAGALTSRLNTLVEFGAASNWRLTRGGAEIIQVQNTGMLLQGRLNIRNESIIDSDAANTLAQRNGATAQTFNIYNTYTDASNYERGFMRWNSNVFEIGTAAAGTGSNRVLRFDTPAGGTMIQFYTGGSSRVLISSNGVDFVNLPLRASTSTSSTDLGATGREFRDLYIYRNVYLTGLPTSNPAVAGQLWNDAGTVKVSAG